MARRPFPERSPALARLCETDPLGIDEERHLFNRLKEARKGTGRRRSAQGFGAAHVQGRARAPAGQVAALRNRIALANLRLVVSLAKRFASPERPLEDLVSEASILLLRCVEKFDAGRGTRFSTYATCALTRHFQRLCRRERRSRFASLTTLGRQQASEPRRSEGLEGLIHREELQRLTKGLSELLARERSLLTGRFGLDGNAPRTFRELAISHGFSKEWARVTTAEALEGLRNSLSDSRKP